MTTPTVSRHSQNDDGQYTSIFTPNHSAYPDNHGNAFPYPPTNGGQYDSPASNYNTQYNTHSQPQYQPQHVSQRQASARPGGANDTSLDMPGKGQVNHGLQKKQGDMGLHEDEIGHMTGFWGAAKWMVTNSAAERRKHHLQHRRSKRLTAEQKIKNELLAFFRKLAAEAIGTFIITFMCANYAIQTKFGAISVIGNAIASGAALVAIIYAFGEISGAHVNPAITLAFLIRRTFPLRWVLPYWCAQMAGALVGGAMIRGFYFEPNASLGDNVTVDSVKILYLSMLMEAVTTFILAAVILSMATRGKIVGPHAALAGGAALLTGAMASGGYSSFSMNPARSLGQCLVNPIAGAGICQNVWPFIAGPMIGAAVAALAVELLASNVNADEEEQMPNNDTNKQVEVAV